MADDKNHMEKIQSILMDLSGEAAFSGEAMKQFLELKNEVDSQESTIDYLRRQRETDKDKIGDLNSKISTMESALGELHHERDGWRQRESELQDREMQCSINEVRMECANARVEDHQSMVGLIFRNSQIRKVTLGQELSHQPGSPEMKNEYGTIVQYHVPAGFEATPVQKDETSEDL